MEDIKNNTEEQEHTPLTVLGSVIVGAIAGFYASGLGQKAFLAGVTLVKNRKNQEVEED